MIELQRTNPRGAWDSAERVWTLDRAVARDLQISEGSLASIAFSAIVSGALSAERRSELRENLLAHCRRDTEATCELFGILR
jgi:hypothetical protein